MLLLQKHNADLKAAAERYSLNNPVSGLFYLKLIFVASDGLSFTNIVKDLHPRVTVKVSASCLCNGH